MIGPKNQGSTFLGQKQLFLLARTIYFAQINPLMRTINSTCLNHSDQNKHLRALHEEP